MSNQVNRISANKVPNHYTASHFGQTQWQNTLSHTHTHTHTHLQLVNSSKEELNRVQRKERRLIWLWRQEMGWDNTMERGSLACAWTVIYFHLSFKTLNKPNLNLNPVHSFQSTSSKIRLFPEIQLYAWVSIGLYQMIIWQPIIWPCGKHSALTLQLIQWRVQLRLIMCRFQSLSPFVRVQIRNSRGFTCLSKDDSTHSQLGQISIFHHTDCTNKRVHAHTHFQHLHDWPSSMFNLADREVLHNSRIRAQQLWTQWLHFPLENSSLLVLRIGNFYKNQRIGHRMTCRLILEGALWQQQ